MTTTKSALLTPEDAQWATELALERLGHLEGFAGNEEKVREAQLAMMAGLLGFSWGCEVIIREVTPDLSLSPQELLNATGRKQYTHVDVVNTMPKGSGGKHTLYFFPLVVYETVAEVGQVCDERGLKLASPYALAQANIDDEEFADRHPNLTYWKNGSGKCCSFAFDHWNGRPNIYCNDRRWCGNWWVSCVPK